MTPITNLLDKLPDASRSGKGWKARCPAHDDRNPSLSIHEAKNGNVLLKCHAGCTTPAVVQAIGLKMADLMAGDSLPPPRNRGDQPSVAAQQRTKPDRSHASLDAAIAAIKGRHDAHFRVWTYHDANGESVGAVIRFDEPSGKTYRPACLRDGKWYETAMPELRPLYALPGLTAADCVVVTEGEKAADAAALLGYVATTSSGGAKAANKTDWSTLAGKNVVILPDNDEAGREYADDVVDLLHSLTPPAKVRVVALNGLPTGGDIADLVDQAGEPGAKELREDVDVQIEQESFLSPPTAGEAALRYEPFPVDVLPEPLRQFVIEAAVSIGCDPCYIAMPLLAACAAAIGNTHRLEVKKSWLVPPILWLVIVGESGSAKTPAMRCALAGTQLREKEAFAKYNEQRAAYQAQLLLYERDLADFRKGKKGSEPPVHPTEPKPERMIASDITIEALAACLGSNPRGLLLGIDELAGWIQSLQRYSGGKNTGDASRYLSLYNADTLIVDRKTGNPSTIRVSQAAVCIVGGIQPGILRRCFTEEHRESGLAARFLLAYPPRQAKKWTEAFLNPETAVRCEAILLRLYDLQPDPFSSVEDYTPLVIGMSPEAKALFQSFYNRHNAELQEYSGDLAAAWSKLEEIPLRLALVIHCVRVVAYDSIGKDAHSVDADSLSMALVLTEWFKHEARRVHVMLRETEASAEDRKLVEWIERRGGQTTVREAQQGVRALKKASDARLALDRLVAAGHGVWVEGSQGKRFALHGSPAELPTAVDTVDSVDVDTGAPNDPDVDWGAI